ncbi:LRR receptor-like serine/threonine-protein kinase FEI 2 [Geodia barretti]|uniref:LRR receptor-like serine/threonine-protein kinase FEI 2 n=1 Tax=Geodia barretti TaxID=519541 RepID=A0AA35S3D0_GEOBA|nr:LRR receptor-like serine/threonine-protein kinase FEI 2 [Geodia barretti]
MDVIKGLEQEGVKVHKSVKETGRILGVGSFGTVVELNIKGFGGCAGKKIHDIFVPEGGFKFLIKECKLMSGLIHPDITKFLGVCLLPSSKFPALVMELMDYSFEDVIENKPATFEKLALTTMISIFIDVASGLAYLHSRTPRVLHRDLTARNVLLDKYMNAKITDFGNSRIIETTIAMKTMTQIPGTQVYMPPEALDVQSRYNDRLDIFSFGHLALYTLIREFPKDILPATYLAPDGKLVARNEVERRSKYMVKLNAALPEENHNLYHLTRQCLHNDPSKRPSSTDLGHWLQEILNFQQGDFQETIEDPYLSEEAVRVQLSLREMEKHLNEYPSDDIQYYEILFNEEGGARKQRKAEQELREASTEAETDDRLREEDISLLEKKSKSKTKGWRAYSFTIDYKKGTFQYNKPSMLGGKSNAIKLADITEIKEMKPNGIRFSFEVHFEGKNSPWELNVYSEV